MPFLMCLATAWGLKGDNPWSHLPDAVTKLVDVWHPPSKIALFTPPALRVPEVSHTPEVMLLAVQEALVDARRLSPGVPTTTPNPRHDAEVEIALGPGDDTFLTLPTISDPIGTLAPTFRCASSFVLLRLNSLQRRSIYRFRTTAQEGCSLP